MSYLPITNGGTCLDAGTGFGEFALELASQYGVSVSGMDYDEDKLSVASQIAGMLKESSFYHSKSHVQFEFGDLYGTPYPDSKFDFTVIRFVYQHLKEPLRVSAELFRITKPGGYVTAIDVDDQFIVSYPQSDSGFSNLQKAFAQLQEQQGGDRYVGRKVASYLHDAGFEITSAVLYPLSGFDPVNRHHQSREFELSKLKSVKREILDLGIMSEDEFEQSFAQYESLHEDTWQFNTNAQVIVTARKP